jgi:spermidine synthase
VTVAELVPAVIQWNREPLTPLAGNPLRDPRVRVEVADVGFTLRANCGRFDAILLDVDNGPSAFTVGIKAGLYEDTGVAAANNSARRAASVYSAHVYRPHEGPP